MKRPYRDLLVWLANIQMPNDQPSVARFNAHAAVATMLAAYDQNARLAARWEQRFAHSRTSAFPFGLTRAQKKLMQTYLSE